MSNNLQSIQYEGNNIHYYLAFDLYPTGEEQDIIEDINEDTLTYDGGEIE